MAYITNDEGTRWVDDSSAPAPSPASEQDERLDDLCEKLRAELRIPCWCEPGEVEGEIMLCHNCGFLRSNIAKEIAAERKRVLSMAANLVGEHRCITYCDECMGSVIECGCKPDARERSASELAASIRKLEER